MAVADVARLQMGAKVLATDGPVGELTAIVVDPVAQAGTQLRITPPHDPDLCPLVALDVAQEAGDPIRLPLPLAQFRGPDSAADEHALRTSGRTWASPHPR